MKNPFSRKTPTIPTDPHQITAENAYLYSPDATRPGVGWFKRFWSGRTKPQQALLITGTATVLFSVLMIGLSLTMLSSTGKKNTQTTVATSQSTNSTSSSTPMSSTDEADQSNTDSQTAASASTDDVSWWQSLLSKVSGRHSANSNASTSSDSTASSYSIDENYDQFDDDEAIYDTYDYSNISEEPSGIKQKNIGDLTSFSIATYNIRTTNLNRWDTTRANAILDYIESVDIVGIQEGKDDSVNWLKTKLATAGYSSAAYSNGGEYRAIFWRNNKFRSVKQGSKNLSDGRNVSWVNLKTISKGTSFYFLDTHLRLWTTTASGGNTTDPSKYRSQEIGEILNFVRSEVKESPVILVGDMNSRPGSDVDKLVRASGFYNLYNIAATKNNLTYSTTVNNFNGGISGKAHTGNSRIDNMYVKNNVSASSVTIMIKQRGSDHIPVEGIVSL